MSSQVRVSFNDIIQALKPLNGLKVTGVLDGPPTRYFPFKEFVEFLRDKGLLTVEGYRDILVGALRVERYGWIVFHCKYGDIPDDFAIAFKGNNSWELLVNATSNLSRLTKITFTEALSAILHGIQGVYLDKGSEVYEIVIDEVADETVNWLPEFFEVS